MQKEKSKNAIECNKCVHFYITWDKKYPKGCKAMAFKCAEIPSLMVYKLSGVECLRFEHKQARGNRP